MGGGEREREEREGGEGGGGRPGIEKEIFLPKISR